MRADRGLAAIAFLLAVTALLLPWWRVTLDDGSIEQRMDFRAFRPAEGWTTSWGPWLTGGIAAVAVLVLFVRLAANSHQHEPASWRRDLALAGVLLVAAAASCLLWPTGVPAFWGGRTYQLANTTGPATTETAIPGLGWWLALVAAACCLGAWWLARRRVTEDDVSAPAGGTDK